MTTGHSTVFVFVHELELDGSKSQTKSDGDETFIFTSWSIFLPK